MVTAEPLQVVPINLDMVAPAVQQLLLVHETIKEALPPLLLDPGMGTQTPGNRSKTEASLVVVVIVEVEVKVLVLIVVLVVVLVAHADDEGVETTRTKLRPGETGGKSEKKSSAHHCWPTEGFVQPDTE